MRGSGNQIYRKVKSPPNVMRYRVQGYKETSTTYTGEWRKKEMSPANFVGGVCHIFDKICSSSASSAEFSAERCQKELFHRKIGSVPALGFGSFPGKF